MQLPDNMWPRRGLRENLISAPLNRTAPFGKAKRGELDIQQRGLGITIGIMFEHIPKGRNLKSQMSAYKRRPNRRPQTNPHGQQRKTTQFTSPLVRVTGSACPIGHYRKHLSYLAKVVHH